MAAEQGLDAAQAEQMVEIAEHEHCNDDIAIDPNPLLSVGNDGCWVQGWLWVRFPESMLEPEVEPL